jgi:hypothetical protein
MKDFCAERRAAERKDFSLQRSKLKSLCQHEAAVAMALEEADQVQILSLLQAGM